MHLVYHTKQKDARIIFIRRGGAGTRKIRVRRTTLEKCGKIIKNAKNRKKHKKLRKNIEKAKKRLRRNSSTVRDCNHEQNRM